MGTASQSQQASNHAHMEVLWEQTITTRLDIKAVWDQEFSMGFIVLLDMGQELDFMGAFQAKHKTIDAAKALRDGISNAFRVGY